MDEIESRFYFDAGGLEDLNRLKLFLISPLIIDMRLATAMHLDKTHN